MNYPAVLQRSRRGFTVLEMVAVLFVIVLMVALGVSAFRMVDDTDPFEEPVTKLRQMSKLALHSAALYHRGQSIAFDKAGFGMVGASSGAGAYYRVPDNTKVLIMRWGGKGWEKAEGHVWPFGEQGICEPVKVRFENAEGFRELLFHPMTGTPVEN
jgi:hypothetical protein